MPITERPRSDGTVAYKAEVIVYQEGRRRKFSKTFDKKVSAERWIKRQQAQLKRPDGIAKQDAKKKTLSSAIDRYVETNPQIGRTKAQVLRAIQGHRIGSRLANRIEASDIVKFATDLHNGGRKPQTVNNYLSHLSAVFQVAESAWQIPLDPAEMKKAMVTAQRLNLISKSGKRDRRPTIEEMDLLMDRFSTLAKRKGNIPIHVITMFALFSTRRQGEICRIFRKDYQPEHKRVLVRDMKHPGQKIGNDVWCELPDVACQLIEKYGQDPVLFPYKTSAVTASFTRACKILGIEDLHFHDLRHEGVSRLFEMGLTIPQVASYSGHRSWASLQRYAHLRSTGDKWQSWDWIKIIV